MDLSYVEETSKKVPSLNKVEIRKTKIEILITNIK